MKPWLRISALLLPCVANAQVLDGPPPPEVDWQLHLGEAVPLETGFRDSDGTFLTLREALDSRPAVLVLLYYECPMLCDLVLQGLVSSLKAIDFLPGRDFTLVAISIDPDETTEMARHKRDGYLSRYGREVDSSGWKFLTGSEPAIRSVADAVGFGYTYLPASGEYAHAAGITLLTPRGVVSRYLFGIEFAPRDLRLALIEASEGRIGSAVDKFLLRCFHYDPTRGRYGFAILSAIRMSGILTVVLIGAFVIRWILRDRRRLRIDDTAMEAL